MLEKFIFKLMAIMPASLRGRLMAWIINRKLRTTKVELPKVKFTVNPFQENTDALNKHLNDVLIDGKTLFTDTRFTAEDKKAVPSALEAQRGLQILKDLMDKERI